MSIGTKASVQAVAVLFAAVAALALVRCDRTTSTSNQAVQAVKTASPTAAAPAGYIYITNNGEGTVSEFSRQADGSLYFLRAVKAGPVNGPAGIAIDPSNRFLYVANEGDGRIYQFRINRDTGDLAMVSKGSVEDGPESRPQQIAVSPRSDFVYITNAGKGSDGSIAEYVIGSATGALKPLETFRGRGVERPLGIAFSPNGKFVYVSDSGAGTIDAFVVESSGKLKLLASMPSLGDKPGHPGLIAVHPSGNFVYTVDGLLGVVVAARPDENGVLSVAETYHVGISTSGPFGIALAAVGPKVFIYTGNRGSDTISSFAVNSNALDLVGECPTGMGYPTGMVADPGGRNLYVVNRDASTVAQFAIAETNGVALNPTASIFTEAPINEASHPLYVAMTRWDAPPSVARVQEQRTN